MGVGAYLAHHRPSMKFHERARAWRHVGRIVGSFAVRSSSLLLALSLSLTALGCGPALPESRPHPLLSKTPEPIEQPTLEGDLVRFPRSGRVTVVDFWSTVCEPCIEMMPAIEAMHREHKGAGLVVVGVAIDDNPGLVDQRLRKLGITYANILDDAGSTVRGAYQVDDLPTTFIFDKKGVLRVVTKGGDAADVAKIRDAVEFLLSE